MTQRDLFLMADAALRDVIDMLEPEQLAVPVPAEWSRKANPTLRDILAAHAYDEAWVPDLIAGRTIAEVGDRYDGELLGEDPIESYDELNDAATEAVSGDLDLSRATHLSYGDFPLGEALEHLTIYRAFQAWSIARLVGLDFSLPDPLVDGLWESVIPNVESWREIGVFPPEVAVPAGADRETQLLGKTGYWVP